MLGVLPPPHPSWHRSSVVMQIPFPCLLHTSDTHSKKPKVLWLQLSVKLLTFFPFEISISGALPEDLSVPVHTDRTQGKERAAPDAGGCCLHLTHQLHVEFSWDLWLGPGLRLQTKTGLTGILTLQVTHGLVPFSCPGLQGKDCSPQAQWFRRSVISHVLHGDHGRAPTPWQCHALCSQRCYTMLCPPAPAYRHLRHLKRSWSLVFAIYSFVPWMLQMLICYMEIKARNRKLLFS